MSFWDEHGCEEKVRGILSEVTYRPDPQHPFGRPFLTAYQVAIEFAARFPEVRQELGYEIGGRGTGRHVSLTQYLARELSPNIRAGALSDIEGAFLSGRRLPPISFDYEGERIVSSVANVSSFRLVDE